MQGTLAREHVSTQGTLASKYVFSTQGTQFSRLAFMTLQICSLNTEAGVPRCSVKMVFLTDFEFSHKIHLKVSISESFIKKVASYWLMKKNSNTEHLF